MKKSQRADELRKLHEEIEKLPQPPDDYWGRLGQHKTWDIPARVQLLEATHRLYMMGLSRTGGRPAAKYDPDWVVLSCMTWLSRQHEHKAKGHSDLAKTAIGYCPTAAKTGGTEKSVIERLARKYSKLSAGRKKSPT
jgi:hypothetical protein